MRLLAATSVPDPSWLLSSAAQSAAALVAIVGGLLVSRIVALASQRQGAEARRKSLLARIRIRQTEWDRVHADRLGRSIEVYERHHISEFVRQRGQVDGAKAASEWVPLGSSPEEMEPIVRHFASRIEAAFAHLELVYPGPQFPLADLKAFERDNVTIPEGDESIYLAVANHIATERRPPDRFGSLRGFVQTSLRTNDDLEDQRQDHRIESEQELAAQLHALKAEVAVVDDELLGLARPRGVFAGIAVLTYFGIVGVLVPLGFLASRPLNDSLALRRWIVVLFATGFVAVVGYIVWSMLNLRRIDEGDD